MKDIRLCRPVLRREPGIDCRIIIKVARFAWGRKAVQLLSEGEKRIWNNAGWLLKPAVFSQPEIAAALEEAWLNVRRLDETDRNAEASRNAAKQFQNMASFPYKGTNLCNLATSPALLHAARALFDVDAVQLYQSQLWAKHQGAAEFEQTHHRDYARNTPLGPCLEDGRPSFLGGFVYLTDVDEETGPTALVSRPLTRHLPLEPARYERSQQPDLYRHEELAVGKAGSVLFYAADTFHRATAIRRPASSRVGIKFSIKPQECVWVSYHSGIGYGEEPHWSHFAMQASMEQWELLGIPGTLPDQKCHQEPVCSYIGGE